MVERCDFYSQEEYEYALSIEFEEQHYYDAQQEYLAMQALVLDS